MKHTSIKVKTPRGTARAKRRQNFAVFAKSRPDPLPANLAIKKGVASAEWNRYLSTLSEPDRKKVVKQMRSLNFMDHHLASGPTASTYQRYRIEMGGGQ